MYLYLYIYINLYTNIHVYTYIHMYLYVLVNGRRDDFLSLFASASAVLMRVLCLEDIAHVVEFPRREDLLSCEEKSFCLCLCFFFRSFFFSIRFLSSPPPRLRRCLSVSLCKAHHTYVYIQRETRRERKRGRNIYIIYVYIPVKMNP